MPEDDDEKSPEEEEEGYDPLSSIGIHDPEPEEDNPLDLLGAVAMSINGDGDPGEGGGLSGAVLKLTDAVTDLSRGNGKDGPLGLEAVVMALGGSGRPGHDGGVAGALLKIADSNESIAIAIKDLATAIREGHHG